MSSSPSVQTARAACNAAYVPIRTTANGYRVDVAELIERVRRTKSTGRSYVSASLNVNGGFLTRDQLLDEIRDYATQTLTGLLFRDDENAWDESALKLIKNLKKTTLFPTSSAGPRVCATPSPAFTRTRPPLPRRPRRRGGGERPRREG